MTEIEIGGRKVPLSYTAYEMIEIQKQIGCTAFQLKDAVFGLRLENEDDPKSLQMDVTKDPERLEKLGALIAILGNAGLEAQGQEPDLTAKWVLRNMKPALIMTYAAYALGEIILGNTMEAKREENGPVDEGLEEEQAKKQPGN